MKANAIIWKHNFNMHTMQQMSTSFTKEIDVKIPANINAKLLKVAIEGKTPYEEFFKKNAFTAGFSHEYIDRVNQILSSIGDDLLVDAHKIVLEFPTIGNVCFVLRDDFGNKSSSFVDHSVCDTFN